MWADSQQQLTFLWASRALNLSVVQISWGQRFNYSMEADRPRRLEGISNWITRDCVDFWRDSSCSCCAIYFCRKSGGEWRGLTGSSDISLRTEQSKKKIKLINLLRRWFNIAPASDTVWVWSISTMRNSMMNLSPLDLVEPFIGSAKKTEFNPLGTASSFIIIIGKNPIRNSHVYSSGAAAQCQPRRVSLLSRQVAVHEGTQRWSFVCRSQHFSRQLERVSKLY